MQINAILHFYFSKMCFILLFKLFKFKLRSKIKLKQYSNINKKFETD